MPGRRARSLHAGRAALAWIVAAALGAAALGAAALGASPQPAAPTSTDTTLAITAARLLDVARGTIVSNATVLVRDGRIVAAGRSGGVPIPPSAKRLDLGDVTLLPGLIDTHVHLSLQGRPRANALATLRAGFTTVQDLGAPGYVNVSLRDSVRAGVCPGPRIVSSGPWLGVTGGTCDFNGIGVHNQTEALQRVLDDAARGADVIKVCVTGWVSDGVATPDKQEFSDADLAAIVAEARKTGMPVIAHAIGEAGIRAAVRAGITGAAHAAFVDDETARAMRDRDIYMASTLVSLTQQGDSAAYHALWARTGRARALGVPIVLGTDAGVVPHGTNAKEFAALVRLGMSPADAIRAGTLGAAEALRLSDSLGTLDPGKIADIVAVHGNPLDDVTALERVSFVMQRGVTVRP